MFSLICVWINDWVNNREAGDSRRHRGHYDVIVMLFCRCFSSVDAQLHAQLPSDINIQMPYIKLFVAKYYFGIADHRGIPIAAVASGHLRQPLIKAAKANISAWKTLPSRRGYMESIDTDPARRCIFQFSKQFRKHLDGLMQKRHNSSARELHLHDIKTTIL